MGIGIEDVKEMALELWLLRRENAELRAQLNSHDQPAAAAQPAQPSSPPGTP